MAPERSSLAISNLVELHHVFKSIALERVRRPWHRRQIIRTGIGG
jgi:hypothetical protein